MDKFAAEFARLLRASGVKNSAIAAAFGIDPSNVSQWRKGNRPIPSDRAPLIAEMIGAAPEQISEAFAKTAQAASGRLRPVSQFDATLTHPSLPRFERVTVRGAAMVGEDGFWEELEDVGGAYVEWRSRHGDEYAIEIKSDRYHPEIRRGALVIFSPSKALAFNEYALVKLHDGRSTILEFLRQDGDLYTFTALQSGGRRVSLGASQIEHVHAYAGMAPASDKQVAAMELE